MPIIVISARSEDADKIEALDAGADDYITKPFPLKNFLHAYALPSAVLQLFNPTKIRNPLFYKRSAKIDYTAGCTYLNGVELHLTPIEYKLL